MRYATRSLCDEFKLVTARSWGIHSSPIMIVGEILRVAGAFLLPFS